MTPALVVPGFVPQPGASLVSLFPVRGLASGLLSVITGWIVEGTARFVAALGASLTRVSEPDFGAGFLAPFHEVVLIGAALALPFLLIAAIQAIVRQDLGLLLRAAFLRLPAALLLGAAASELVGVLVGVTDECCNALLTHGGVPLNALIARLSGAIAGSGAQAPGPGFGAVVLALLAMVVALALWIELAVRSAAITVATLFLPLVLAGLVWSATAQWARRLAGTIVALVFTKLVVVGVLVLAASTALHGSGWSAIGTGLALLVVAALAPFAVLRLVPIVEMGAVGHLEGIGRQGARAGLGYVGGAVGWAAAQIPGQATEGVEPAKAKPDSERQVRATIAEMAAEQRGERGGEAR